MQAQRTEAELQVSSGRSTHRQRQSRAERIASLVAQIDKANPRLLRGSTVLEALTLVLTHPRLQGALLPFQQELMRATSVRTSPTRAASLIVEAADLLVRMQVPLPDVELLRVALLEYAHSLSPSIERHAHLMRAYVRLRGSAESVLDQKVPFLDDSIADGRERGLATQGLAHHASKIAGAALRATAPSTTRPFRHWSAPELRGAVVAIRALYVLCRQSIRGAATRLDLSADFVEYGAPVWSAAVEELHRRGQAEKTWSTEWQEDSQAQVALTLEQRPAGRRNTETDGAPELPQGTEGHVVCRQPIPSSADKSDQDEIQRHRILQKPLPVLTTPPADQLNARHARLVAEFPWAEDAIRQIFVDLRARAALGVRALCMPATLLVGPPGSGKSRLARRLGEVLELPLLDLPLGGTTDSKVLSGTSRGWASGKPSDLAMLLASRQCASALVILDEIDKAVGATTNDGGLQSYLLGLLEPETAARHRDNFLKVECDYSKVSWIATANRLSTLPAPLLSRMRVLLVGNPQPHHMESVAEGVIAEMATRWGVDRWALPAPGELALPFDRLSSVRQVRQSCEAAVATWAASLARH
jgi:MoxR-like ATPase